MDDETTTVDTGADTGVDTSTQPETDAFGETAAPSPEPTTTTETTTPDAAPVADENVAWLQNKGIDPSDPDAIAKLAQMARNAEKAMHEARQPKLGEALQAPVAPDDQLMETPDQVTVLQQQVEAMQLRTAVTDFFAADGDAGVAAERKALEPAMSQIVLENPAIGQMVKSGYMSYGDLFAMAKGNNPNYAASLKQDGGREALEKVAAKQQARAVQGVATTSAVSGDTKGDAFLDGFNSVK
jgi:hypothetical protein